MVPAAGFELVQGDVEVDAGGVNPSKSALRDVVIVMKEQPPLEVEILSLGYTSSDLAQLLARHIVHRRSSRNNQIGADLLISIRHRLNSFPLRAPGLARARRFLDVIQQSYDEQEGSTTRWQAVRLSPVAVAPPVRWRLTRHAPPWLWPQSPRRWLPAPSPASAPVPASCLS